jgi:tetratricopeptide (TPR) repeat protein
MIVKNESRIIRRLFDSVVDIIDSYCICDTGSTDNTVDIIKTYFDCKKIPGKIVYEPFRDFGYNRSFALKQCDGMENADYILLLDADMVIQIPTDFNLEVFKEGLINSHAFFVFQGTDEFYYKNVRIVKNNLGMKYWGVTHEYVEVPEGCVYGKYEKKDFFILDIGDGGSKTDKFERDILLLKKGLEEIPNNDRYTFYLANSYYNSGHFAEAIETYKKRIEIGGWIEEVWQCYYTMGICYRNLGEMEKAICSWMDAYSAFPERIENLYEIVHYYRNNAKNRMAYHFYTLADKTRKKFTSNDYLFLQKDIYDYKLDYELSIIGFYENMDNYDMNICCMKLLAYPKTEEWMFNNILSNYKFYCKKLEGGIIYNIQLDKSIIPNNDFYSSTPSFCVHNGELVVNTRFVNYVINENGGYENKEHIETINILSRYSLEDGIIGEKIKPDTILKHDTTHDGLYIGLEDVRLFSNKGYLIYNANRGIDRNQVAVENGIIDLKTSSTFNSQLLKYTIHNDIEKNWVLFEDNQNKLKCIYKWWPLIIGDIQKEGKFKTTHKINTPPLFKRVRGSTNGLIVENEIWFIGHVVSYEDRRYYYHILIAIDRNSFELKRFSDLFTFSKEKVEYTLGFDKLNENQFLIGYSIMDKKTEYIVTDKDYLSYIMKYVI